MAPSVGWEEHCEGPRHLGSRASLPIYAGSMLVWRSRFPPLGLYQKQPYGGAVRNTPPSVPLLCTHWEPLALSVPTVGRVDL
jgi:hypothetical protein